MPLYVKNPEVVALVEDLVQRTGESKTKVLLRALEERKSRLDKSSSQSRGTNPNRVLPVLERIDSLPVLDTRSPDEILGYTESGDL